MSSSRPCATRAPRWRGRPRHRARVFLTVSVLGYRAPALPLDKSQDHLRHSRTTATTPCLDHVGGGDLSATLN
eukprot:14877273-Alexandrium_andersonii.AAC.1